ncbi:PREDICTED: adaptin ear-binding coat-associated protein 2 [Nipponia nippon]|nr:PREDICTED: adaptin ear-binding coat-associated protein 2 [Nipponia nippon]
MSRGSGPEWLNDISVALASVKVAASSGTEISISGTEISISGTKISIFGTEISRLLRPGDQDTSRPRAGLGGVPAGSPFAPARWRINTVNPAVPVYGVPPRASNRGYRWELQAGGRRPQPAWSGRLRITAKGKIAFIKLEDKTSGELFAQAPVEQFPGIAVESVTDSSRYFVIRIEDGNGRRAFIGVGFVDRGDAFDFNVALQDHFKWVRQQSELAKQAQNPDQGPKLDLGFKEGQTIKLNIANMKKKEGATGNTRPRPAGPGGLSLLPPPPGGKSSAPVCPSGERPSSLSAPTQLPGTPITDSLLSWPQPAAAPSAAAADVWGDFAKASGSASNPTQANAGWVQF